MLSFVWLGTWTNWAASWDSRFFRLEKLSGSCWQLHTYYKAASNTDTGFAAFDHSMHVVAILSDYDTWSLWLVISISIRCSGHTYPEMWRMNSNVRAQPPPSIPLPLYPWIYNLIYVQPAKQTGTNQSSFGSPQLSSKQRSAALRSVHPAVQMAAILVISYDSVEVIKCNDI